MKNEPDFIYALIEAGKPLGKSGEFVGQWSTNPEVSRSPRYVHHSIVESLARDNCALEKSLIDVLYLVEDLVESRNLTESQKLVLEQAEKEVW